MFKWTGVSVTIVGQFTLVHHYSTWCDNQISTKLTSVDYLGTLFVMSSTEIVIFVGGAAEIILNDATFYFLRSIFMITPHPFLLHLRYVLTAFLCLLLVRVVHTRATAMPLWSPLFGASDPELSVRVQLDPNSVVSSSDSGIYYRRAPLPICLIKDTGASHLLRQQPAFLRVVFIKMTRAFPTGSRRL